MSWAALIRIPALRYGLALLAVAALLAGLAWWHHSVATNAIQTALNGQRAELQRKAAEVLASVRQEQLEERNKASMALLELTHAYSTMLEKVIHDAASSRAALQRLQYTLSALRSGGATSTDGTTTISLTDAAPALADSLGQCGDRYASLAAGFDQLSVQVTGLQKYITEVAGPVCLASQ